MENAKTKEDAPREPPAEPGGFVANEYLENRLALRDGDPAKYLRETSQALRITVERYAELKAHARAADASGDATG